jgi:phosphoribosylaminoimidazole-succinocarboxamide synthase
MDMDRFRQDLGKVEEAYQEVARRLGILAETANSEDTKTNITSISGKKK